MQSSGGSGTGTVNSGTTGQSAYYASSGTAVSGTSAMTYSGNNVGIGTTNPGQALDVNGSIRTNAGITTASEVDCVSQAGSDGSICSMSTTTTTGTITSGTNSLSVASASGWVVGMGINVSGAGSAGADLISYITNISGTTFTLNDNANTSVTGNTVNHDDTRAINTASASGKNPIFRLGLYPVSSAINLATSVLFAGSGALNLEDQATPQGLGTVFVEHEKTNSWLNITAGSVYVRDVSFETASGVTPTAGYAFVVGNSSRIANDVIENVSSYGSMGGIDINTHVAVGYFDHVYMITQGNSTSYAAILVNNPSPYGDDVFNSVTAIAINNGGYGIEITGADVNMYTNVKMNGYGYALYISGTVFNQFFTGCSLEGQSASGSLAYIGSGAYNITFTGGEFGVDTGGSNYGVDLEGTAKQIAFTGVQFHDLTNGLEINNTGGHVTLSNNVFNLITNAAISIAANIPNISINGDVASGTIVNSGSTVNYFSVTNVGIGSTSPGQSLDVQGSIRTNNVIYTTNSGNDQYTTSTKIQQDDGGL